MSTMWGADADELERIAKEFRKTADELNAEASAMTRMLAAVDWMGAVANEFLSTWSSVQVPRMDLSTAFLNNTATQLERQAKEQREASDSISRGRVAPPLRLTPDQKALVRDLANIRDGSAQQQRDWWSGLTEEQRAFLLDRFPDRLVPMDGLPKEVHQAALSGFLDNVRGDVPALSTEYTGEIAARWQLIGGEVKIGFHEKEFLDGHIEVGFDGGLAGGLDAKVASAMLTTGVAGTYTFANRAEYERFVTGFRDKVIDLYPANTASETVEYLQANSHHLKSAEISGGVRVKADLGFAKSDAFGAEVDAGFKVSHDMVKGSSTVSGFYNLEAEAGKFEGKVSAGASVTYNEYGEAVSIKLNAQGSATGDVLAALGERGHQMPEGLKGHVGGSVSGEVTYDLSDPYVRQSAHNALESFKSGDLAATAREMSKLSDHGQVVVTTATTVTDEYGFDVKVIEAEVSASSAATKYTFARPPGGRYYRVN